MQVDSFLTCTVLYLDNCYFKKDFFILIIILIPFLLWLVYNFLYSSGSRGGPRGPWPPLAL